MQVFIIHEKHIVKIKELESLTHDVIRIVTENLKDIGLNRARQQKCYQPA